MPFYYNYYYAGQVRFFADYSWMTQKYRVGENWVYETLIRPNQLATLYYIGFAHLSARIVLLGLLFIPLGFALTLLIFYKTWKMNPLIGILFFLISLLLIWPTLGYMGAAGYPRFQMVNYSVIIIAYLILADSKEKFISKHRGNHWSIAVGSWLWIFGFDLNPIYRAG